MRKFTLMELLIVVAIIGILVSLLLPSLQGARDKAKDAVCLSNQRQIGVMMSTYTIQQDGIFPSHRLDMVSSWIELIDPNPAENLYICPRVSKWTYSNGSQVTPDASTKENRLHLTSYGYNAWWLGYYVYTNHPTGKNYLRMTEIDSPSDVIMTADSRPIIVNGNYWWGTTLWYIFRRKGPDQNEGVHSFHGNKQKNSNILFTDGHVKSRLGAPINFDSNFDYLWNPRPDDWNY